MFEPQWQHYEQTLQALVRRREHLLELLTKEQTREVEDPDSLFERVRQTNVKMWPVYIMRIQEMINHICEVSEKAAIAFSESQDRGDPGLHMCSEDRELLDRFPQGRDVGGES